MGEAQRAETAWDAWYLSARALPPRTDADARAEAGVVAYAELAGRHAGRARALTALDACGTATALRLGGRTAPSSRGMRMPDNRAVAQTINRGVAAQCLDESWLRAAHRAVAVDVAPPRRGRYRRGEAWVALDPADPRTAVFIAPDPKRLPALVDDLVSHCGRVEDAAVPVAALAFAQLVCCHPFDDANGRIGRVLLATLLRRGLGLAHTPPVGLVLGANRRLVGERLAAYRAGDAGAWVAHVADVVTMAAAAGERALTT